MRICVEACGGLCQSDVVTVQGLFPIVQYPRVPGHEVIGVGDAIGAGVHGWTVGARAGVGWVGGSCGYCRQCQAQGLRPVAVILRRPPPFSASNHCFVITNAS